MAEHGLTLRPEEATVESRELPGKGLQPPLSTLQDPKNLGVPDQQLLLTPPTHSSTRSLLKPERSDIIFQHNTAVPIIHFIHLDYSLAWPKKLLSAAGSRMQAGQSAGKK